MARSEVLATIERFDSPERRAGRVRCEAHFHASAPALALANRLRDQRRAYSYTLDRTASPPQFVVCFDGYVGVDYETGETRITVDPQ